MVSFVVMDIDFKNKILIEIQKSGFPLELELTEKLRDENILAFSNIAFQDDNGYIHELDIVSIIFSEENEWAKGPSGINLVIECKKTDKYPWIFFDEGYNPLTTMGVLSKTDYSTDFKNENSEFNPLISCMHTALNTHYYNDNAKHIVKTYFEAFKKPNEQTTIYKAVNNIFHGRKYLKDWFSRSKKNDDNKRRTFLNHYLIVLEGELVLAKKEKELFDVQHTQHVLLTTIDTLSPRKNGLFDNEIIIDVITKEYFSEYIATLKSIATKFNEHLQQIEKNNIIKLRS